MGGWRHLCSRQVGGNSVVLISQKQFTASRQAVLRRKKEIGGDEKGVPSNPAAKR
jgi:hypothetical protein